MIPKSSIRVLNQSLTIQTMMKHLYLCIKASWQKYASEDWIVLDIIITHSVNILEY